MLTIYVARECRKRDEQDGAKKKEIEIVNVFFFGIHVMTLVQMCGFEASDHVDLRADFRIFADTKW